MIVELGRVMGYPATDFDCFFLFHGGISEVFKRLEDGWYGEQEKHVNYAKIFTLYPARKEYCVAF